MSQAHHERRVLHLANEYYRLCEVESAQSASGSTVASVSTAPSINTRPPPPLTAATLRRAGAAMFKSALSRVDKSATLRVKVGNDEDDNNTTLQADPSTSVNSPHGKLCALAVQNVNDSSSDYTPQSEQLIPLVDGSGPPRRRSSTSSAAVMTRVGTMNDDPLVLRVPSNVDVVAASANDNHNEDIAYESGSAGEPRMKRKSAVKIIDTPKGTKKMPNMSADAAWLQNRAARMRSQQSSLEADDSQNCFDSSVASVSNKRRHRQHNVQDDIIDGAGFRSVNDYMIINQLGAGSFGTVYLAQKEGSDNAQFAIKVVSCSSSLPNMASALPSAAPSCLPSASPSRDQSPAMTPQNNPLHHQTSPSPDLETELLGVPKSVLREIYFMRKYQHDHLLPLIEVLHHRQMQQLFLVLPLMKGPLLSVSNRGKSLDGVMDEVRARRLFRQIVRGVRYLHRRNVIHYDIKPANILLDDDDNAYVSDFGTCFIRAAEGLNPAAAGSPAYLPPEALADGVETVPNGTANDMWALGVTLFMMLFGNHPFAAGASNQAEVRRRILDTTTLEFPEVLVEPSDAAKDVIQKLLNRVPERRLTIEQLRKHPFVADDSGTSSATATPARAVASSVPLAAGPVSPLWNALPQMEEPRTPNTSNVMIGLNLGDASSAILEQSNNSFLSPTNEQMVRAITEVRRLEYCDDVGNRFDASGQVFLNQPLLSS